MGMEGWAEGLKGVGSLASSLNFTKAGQDKDGQRTENPFSKIAPSFSTKKYDVSLLDPDMKKAVGLYGGQAAIQKLFGGGDDFETKMKLLKMEDLQSKIDARKKKGSNTSRYTVPTYKSRF
jgi:hypothetical protein